MPPAFLTSLCGLLNLHGVVDDQVHEFVKALYHHQHCTATFHSRATDPDSALNSNRQLLVKPYLDCRMLLEELEDEIDGWQKDFAPTASTSSVHGDFDWFRELSKKTVTDLNSKDFLYCFGFCCLGSVSWVVECLCRGFPLSSQGCQKSALAWGNQPALGNHVDIPPPAPKNKLIPPNLDFRTLFSTIKPLPIHQERAGHNPGTLHAVHALLRLFHSRLLPLLQKWSPWLQTATAPRLPSRPC